MAGFEVVLEDLQSMATTFNEQAGAYRAVTPKLTPAEADSGDGALNAVMHAVLELIGVLHQQLATSITQHSEKLATAHDSYQRRDIDNRFLFDDLMKDVD
ncbi:DUF6317 family protein [Antrihabitans cavernicola]|uniref:PE domain-containing protein n=1 Tax=Antrihabitans cavernicola TaxID=2495913 RepID=A0A5A7S940_9NOCA|nr:DUF6317 family protein [Spelaeibacter cavernicola]KAA0021153.1 hypothetical protein FOY51_19745 [Spelaeibacter cavernicola]